MVRCNSNYDASELQSCAEVNFGLVCSRLHVQVLRILHKLARFLMIVSVQLLLLFVVGDDGGGGDDGVCGGCAGCGGGSGLGGVGGGCGEGTRAFEVDLC